MGPFSNNPFSDPLKPRPISMLSLYLSHVPQFDNCKIFAFSNITLEHRVYIPRNSHEYTVMTFYNCIIPDITTLVQYNRADSYIFTKCTFFKENQLNATLYSAFANNERVKSISFNHCHLPADGNLNSMFYKCISLHEVKFINTDLQPNTTMEGTFECCYHLDTSLLQFLDVSNVKSMANLFRDSLIDDVAPLSSWNVSNVNTMEGTFSGCSRLNEITSLVYWDVSNVKNMSAMFEITHIINTLPLSLWNVSNVRHMNRTFSSCHYLSDIRGLNHWNVSNVSDMREMFRFCDRLQDLTPLRSWNTRKVTDMCGMFSMCRNLLTIKGIESWDVSNVTTMERMFACCIRLTSIEGLQQWNVSNVKIMSCMFQENIQLSDISALSNWSLSSLTDIKEMFYRCKNITHIACLRNWNISNVIRMTYLFSKCHNITDIDSIKTWNIPSKVLINGIFSKISETVDFNRKIQTIAEHWSKNMNISESRLCSVMLDKYSC